MLRDVILPTLGLDIEEAVVDRWLKGVGESVAADEPLVVIETEKSTVEITAPCAGILHQIVQPEGATVPVTKTIAFIETAETAPASLEDVSTPTSGDVAVVRASPGARRLAAELGVDLARVRGTGPRGRIQGEDVRRFVEESRSTRVEVGTTTSKGHAESAPGNGQERPEERAGGHGLPGRIAPLTRKRRVTAERMSLSARSVARITLNMDVDASEMVRLKGDLQPVYEARRGVHLSYDAVLAKVVATALADHPNLNARWTEEGIFVVEAINVGVAVAVEDGLVVPVIHNADRMGLLDLCVELSALTEKAGQGKLSPEDMAGGSFTITNLGMYGVDSFTPIVNPPESAILGVGRIAERPVGRDGQVVLRPMMTLSLSADHRVVDGAPAAAFLGHVRELLENPYLLI